MIEEFIGIGLVVGIFVIFRPIRESVNFSKEEKKFILNLKGMLDLQKSMKPSEKRRFLKKNISVFKDQVFEGLVPPSLARDDFYIDAALRRAFSVNEEG